MSAHSGVTFANFVTKGMRLDTTDHSPNSRSTTRSCSILQLATSAPWIDLPTDGRAGLADPQGMRRSGHISNGLGACVGVPFRVSRQVVACGREEL